jgi:phosphate:Na+ symporter
MLIIELIIGLGVFLFGMVQLERGIEQLNSRWIKSWLSKNTNRPLKSIFTGTAITAIVQSSSMVSLLILAFASAGLIPLINAVGVLLGANLGTTFTGWIVATLGFKLDLDVVALPLIGLGCLVQVFAEKREQLVAGGRLVFGLGMLIFGLSIMKESVAQLPEQVDVEQLKTLNAVSFLLLGTLLTAVIQSSSATMMIALTALNSGIIGLPSAAALIIGADLGTTSTTALGSLKGSPIKRQLALAHISFNVVTALLAFIFLLPLLTQIMQWLAISDPLYSLVAFHSCFNLIGLILFIPFLTPFSQWIGRRFICKPVHTEIQLADVPIAVPEAAISHSQKNVRALLETAIAINLRNLRLEKKVQLTKPVSQALSQKLHNTTPFEKRYEALKHSEGELLRYASKVQTQPLDEQQSEQLVAIIACMRETVFAVKTLKDIRPNLVLLRHSQQADLNQLFADYQIALKLFYQQLLELLYGEHDEPYILEQLTILTQKNEQMHFEFHASIQAYCKKDTVLSDQLSTLFNVNREVWQSGKSLIDALYFWYGYQK